MKPILQLRYLILPTLFTWLLVGITALAILQMWLEMKIAVLFAGLIALVIGAPVGLFWVTPFIVSLARGEFIGFGHQWTYAEDIKAPFTVRAETADGNQVDFFHGLTPQQWHDSAMRIAAHIKAGNKSFSFAVVGQTQRPILVPKMLAAEYIVPVGKGEYELTSNGCAWWVSLSNVPYPYDHAPQKLRELV
jgi:hypothetical protein